MLKILLVEDDYLLAKSTAKLLEKIGGHRVEIAAEPAQIVERCQSGDVDIVLMDINLPGAKWEGKDISGADLSKMLKSQPQTSHIPIILVTAYAMESQRQELLNVSDADDLFTKPVTDYKVLIALIEQLCAATKQK